MGSDPHIPLDLDEGADPAPLPDLAAVQVGEGMNDNIGSEDAVPDQPEGRVIGGLGAQGGGLKIPTPRRTRLQAAAVALERWGAERGWLGPDPYEAMNSPLLRGLSRPRARRVAIQVVKRSPLDLRRPLRIPANHNSATIAALLSAYCRLDVLPEAYRRQWIRWGVEQLEELRRPEYDQPCWSYHFDVETRFFRYAATTPNTIATTFAGYALLDAFELHGDRRALELALGAGEFLLEHTPRTEGRGGAFFGYFPGDRTPIHNASLLACGLLAELHRYDDREDFADAARAGTGYAIAHQRSDGSWPYAELPAGDWVDGHHTGYVLDALGRIAAALDDRGAARARARGLRFYTEQLIDPDGAPRFFDRSRYPLDGQALAQAIKTFTLAAESEPGYLQKAWDVWSWGSAHMRRPDGAFLFQRRRLWTNSTPHVRWVEAPMLEALARLLATEAAARRDESEAE